jgi:hypothetical protein
MSRVTGYAKFGDDEIGSARLWGKACLRHRPDNLRGAGRQADPPSSSLADYSDQVAQKSRAGAIRQLRPELSEETASAFGEGNWSG